MQAGKRAFTGATAVETDRGAEILDIFQWLLTQLLMKWMCDMREKGVMDNFEVLA